MMLKATLRLFNAIPVETKKRHNISKEVLTRTIRNGYILSPEIEPTEKVLTAIEELFISGEKANATFHKSWKIVKDADIEQLVIQQLLHYITTYGFENLGIYNKDTVYIPNEKLDIPDLKTNISLIVIKAMTSEDILKQVLKLGTSGIALSQETLSDIMIIIKNANYEPDFIENIKNRELKTLLYIHYNMAPKEPVEYLRHVIFMITEKSLIIKNKDLIEAIGQGNGNEIDEFLEHAPKNLASIFYRYKPIFLALKKISSNKTFFNKLRKKAITEHKPLKPDYLNSVTEFIKKQCLDISVFSKKLETATIFRKIRLAYALKHRLADKDSIVYRIRNGKGWATDFNWPDTLKEKTNIVLNIVLKSIAKELESTVSGKTFYIPKYIHYTLPATEKMFTGNFPTGTHVSVTDNLIFGINWTNIDKKSVPYKQERVDLDLALIGSDGKLGWDGSYRTRNRDILFSGDVTDAPKPLGATELFFIKNGSVSGAKIITVNYFNHAQGDVCACKLLVAHECPKNFKENYMVNPNNILADATINISKKQNIIGIVVPFGNITRIYFANVSIGNARSSSQSKPVLQTRAFFINSMINSIDLSDILIMSGAKVVTKHPEADEDFIDLSPEKLDKTTFLDMLVRK